MPSALRGKDRTIPLQMLARQEFSTGGLSVSVETKQEPIKITPIAEYYEPTQNLVYSANRYQRKQIKLTGVSVNSSLITSTNPFVFKSNVKKKISIEFECTTEYIAGVSDITTILRISNSISARDIAICSTPIAVDATHNRFYIKADITLNTDDEVSAFVCGYNSTGSSKTVVLTEARLSVFEMS